MSSLFDCFPLEIVIEIASVAPTAWLALAVAYKPFGSYTLTDAGRADAFRAFGRIEINMFDAKKWYMNGRLHRDGEPAIEYPGGTKYWYVNGILHRVGMPAVEIYDGSKEWYRHGKLHRDDGPAIELSNGTKEWYQRGRLLRMK